MAKKDSEHLQFSQQISLTAGTFKLLIEATVDYAIFILDYKGIIQTWNIGATKIFGYEPAEIIGKHFSYLYVKDETEQWLPMQELNIADIEGRCENNNVYRVRKDGTQFSARVVITTIHSKTGETGYGNIIQDLTEQLKAEKKVKRMEATLRLFIENTKEYALYLIDPKGNVITWNNGAERIKGYTADEIIGKNFSQFYTQEDRERNHPQEILNLAQKQGSYHEEGYRVRKDGSLFWANIAITAIYDTKGKLIGFGKMGK